MIRKRYVDTSAGQVHVHELGDGPETVVFLQQTASSGRMFYALMERLQAGRRLLAIDTPGFGGSFDPQGMPLLPQYAEWINEAVNGLGVDAAHVVGHHTGACIAVELADREAWVRSAALYGPVTLTAQERAEFREHYREPIAPTADGAYLQRTWDYLAGLGAGSDLALHHREVVDTLRAYWGRFQIYTAVWEQDFTALYRRLAQPLAILCAPDDVLHPYFERAAAIRPDARRYSVKGSNFEPDQDVAGSVAALEDFWRDLPVDAAL